MESKEVFLIESDTSQTGLDQDEASNMITDQLHRIHQISENFLNDCKNLEELCIGESLELYDCILINIYVNCPNLKTLIIRNINLRDDAILSFVQYRLKSQDRSEFNWSSLNMKIIIGKSSLSENLLKSLENENLIFFKNYLTVNNNNWLKDPIKFIKYSDMVRYEKDFLQNPLEFMKSKFDLINVIENLQMEINRDVIMFELCEMNNIQWITPKEIEGLIYVQTAMDWYQPKRYLDEPLHIKKNVDFVAHMKQISNFFDYINVFDYIKFENAFKDVLPMESNYFHYFPRYRRHFRKLNLNDFMIDVIKRKSEAPINVNGDPNDKTETKITLTEFYELIKRFGKDIEKIYIVREIFNYKEYNYRSPFVIINIIRKFCPNVNEIQLESLNFRFDQKKDIDRNRFFEYIFEDIEEKRKERVRYLYISSSITLTKNNPSLLNETEFLLNLNINKNIFQKIDITEYKNLTEEHFFEIIKLPNLKVLYMNCWYRALNDWRFLGNPNNFYLINERIFPKLAFLQIRNLKKTENVYLDKFLKNIKFLKSIEPAEEIWSNHYIDDEEKVINLRYLEVENCYFEEDDVFDGFDVKFLSLKNVKNLNGKHLKSLHLNGKNLWNLNIENCPNINDDVLFDCIKNFEKLLWLKIENCPITNIFIYTYIDYEMLLKNLTKLKWSNLKKIYIFENCNTGKTLTRALRRNEAIFKYNRDSNFIYMLNKDELREKYERLAEINDLDDANLIEELSEAINENYNSLVAPEYNSNYKSEFDFYS